MGTTRRRKIASRQPVTDAMRTFLETGDFRGPDVGFEVYSLVHNEDKLRELFAAYDLASWAAGHPGTRPWAWWRLRAREPRAVVRGASLLLPRKAPDDWTFIWRADFGVQAFQQWRPRGAALPRVESEATYLERLGLLLPGERDRLDAEDFEPETVNPFAVTEAELDKLSILDRRNLTSGETIVDAQAIRWALRARARCRAPGGA